jgi:hypothetical protein
MELEDVTDVLIAVDSSDNPAAAVVVVVPETLVLQESSLSPTPVAVTEVAV